MTFKVNIVKEVNVKILGLAKLAEQETEAVLPEEKEDETLVTCMSDCMYSQNPEKRCMLKSISLQMSEDGKSIFACGQYSPVQQMDQQEEDVSNVSGESQNKKQLGLSGAKK